jgi:hypothetical protein
MEQFLSHPKGCCTEYKTEKFTASELYIKKCVKSLFPGSNLNILSLLQNPLTYPYEVR